MHGELDDARATDPVERLLEDSWETRSSAQAAARCSSRPSAALLFLRIAIPLAAPAIWPAHSLNPVLALLPRGAVRARRGSVRFPIGAGYVVPSYLVLVPMLLLLPPATVPLLAPPGWCWRARPAGGTARRSTTCCSRSRRVARARTGARADRSPATDQRRFDSSPVSTSGAFIAGCIVDLVTSTIREAAPRGRPALQLRVIALVWLIDACIAPLGLLLAYSARHDHLRPADLLPLSALLLLLDRDRSARIAQAQHRLELVGARAHPAAGGRAAPRRRVRRQARPPGADHHRPARLDRGARRRRRPADARRPQPAVPDRRHGPRRASRRCSRRPTARAAHARAPAQLERDGVWALALPFGSRGAGRRAAAARSPSPARSRHFRDDEQALMLGLVERAHAAVRRDPRPRALREQARHRPAHRLGNRRKLAADLAERLGGLAATRAARADAVRPRRLQDLQRHLRPPRRRCHAGAPGRQARRGGRPARNRLPARRR